MQLPIPDRVAAGAALAEELSDYRARDDVILLALPRGGVPVAYEIASALNVRLDLVLVRKLGLPFHDELAMGAIASGGVRVMNEEVVRAYSVSDEDIETVAAKEQAELDRRNRAYRGDRPLPDLKGQCVILVDDGIATGATMLAAIDAVRQQQVAELKVAVPVAPSDTIARLSKQADEVICLATPEPFYAIGGWYAEFGQVSDEEVLELIQRAWKREEERVSSRQT